MISSGKRNYKTIVKSADEFVNNSVALQDDNELYFAMVANGIYLAELDVIAFDSVANTAGLLLGITQPVGSWAHGIGPTLNTAGTLTLGGILNGAQVAVYAEQTNDCHSAFLRFLIRNGANAGNFQLQFAQNAAQVQNTGIRAGSTLSYLRVQ